MAADKTGTSDPYVVFTVNGERVHKSDTIRKTLNPKWQRERFTVPIVSTKRDEGLDENDVILTQTLINTAIKSDSQYPY